MQWYSYVGNMGKVGMKAIKLHLYDTSFLSRVVRVMAGCLISRRQWPGLFPESGCRRGRCRCHC